MSAPYPMTKGLLIAVCFILFASGCSEAQSSDWCEYNGSPASACEWTGDCQVSGCAQRCQVDATLGGLSNVLNDRAFDTDWWQMCPKLAHMVRFYKDLLLDFTPTAPTPSSNDSDEETDYSSEPTVEASLLFQGGARRLQQRPDKQYWNLTCPTVEDIDLVSSRLIGLGLDVENVLQAQLEGRALTADELNTESFQDNPNGGWTVLPYLLEPAKLAAYVQANCTNKDLGGASRAGRRQQYDFHLYHGDWNDDVGHLGDNETFGMCVDTFGGYEAYARDDDIKDQACKFPFGDIPSCHALIYGVYYWPTTFQCADKMAELYRVDPKYTRAMRDIILEAKAECAAITTKEECENVPRAPYEKNITAVEESIPLRSNNNATLAEAGSSSTTTPSESPPSLFPSGDITEDDSGGTGTSTGPLGAEEEVLVTEEDLETSAAGKPASYCNGHTWAACIAILCSLLGFADRL